MGTSTCAFTIGLPESSTAKSFCDRFGRLPVPELWKRYALKLVSGPYKPKSHAVFMATLQPELPMKKFFKSADMSPETHAVGGGFANLTLQQHEMALPHCHARDTNTKFQL